MAMGQQYRVPKKNGLVNGKIDPVVPRGFLFEAHGSVLGHRVAMAMRCQIDDGVAVVTSGVGGIRAAGLGGFEKD